MKKWLLHGAVKPVLLVVLFLPFVWLVFLTVTEQWGANPTEALVRATGDWTLRMLCLVLAITPLRVIGKTPALARFRRMVGLAVFGYVSLHLLSYAGFDMDWVIADIAKDIAKRPFILVGFTAFVLLSLLAATSFNRAVKWLGAARWQALHKTVYAIACLAILHFFWMRAGKRNFAEVAVYATILGALLSWRVWRKWSERKARLRLV
jgi:methionine sulfoxide reductase heme-binding subunit